jgi:DNA-binding beta-propeller fold protein YncE
MIFIAVAGLLPAQTPSPARRVINLPTSKILTAPAPGRIGSTNSFPATMVVSPDGQYAALLNDGYGTQETNERQSIAVLDLRTNRIADFPDARFGTEAHQSYFLGLGFSSDGKHLYASVGSLSDPTGEKPGDLGNGVAVYSFSAGEVAPERFIRIPLQPLPNGKKLAVGLTAPPHMAIPYPAGIAVISAQGANKNDGNKNRNNDKLLVANNLSDNVVFLDAATGKVLQTYDLGTGDLVPSSYPYTCVATKDGRRAWCSLWNASQVVELDLTGGKIANWIKAEPLTDIPLPYTPPQDPLVPGTHPTALLLSPDEKILYIALSNLDLVEAVSTAQGSMLGAFATDVPWPTPRGGYPTALALSSDGTHLMAADSSLDAVVVFSTKGPNDKVAEREADLAELQTTGMAKTRPYIGPLYTMRTPLGFIPTDWYPSALAVHGDDLLIATAKGEGTGPNKVMGKTDYDVKHHKHPYIPTLLRGSVARLNIPATLAKLLEYTQMVERDNLFKSDPGAVTFANGKNPIKHVIYVIKENRTYDQILGDLHSGNQKVGDGDPSLTLYGEDITPNEHALALQFGVLDNFYDSGEVSGDGHVWSTAAITSDYNEKTWQIAYRGKERTYDFQGQNAGEYPLDHNLPDIDDPATGFLWDNLARNHVSFRDYGEYVSTEWCNEKRKAASPKQGTPSDQTVKCPRTNVHEGGTLPPNVGDPHAGPSPYPWAVPLFSGVKPTKAVLRDHVDPLFPDFNTDYPDQLRADEFLNEFGAFVRARQENADPELWLPSFILLYLPDDHTGGTRPDRPRPAANVADNDLALGRVVDAVSHSPYWDDTAIFVVEDDAQDGADHVDAHRSIALTISKYAPGSAAHPDVEHRFYTTVNMIHTMEMLLGLPPMNQNDAYAPVMSGLFSGAGDQPPYKADDRNLKNGLIYETNKRDAPGAKISSRLDFSRPDAAGAAQLNRVLWQDQKGESPMPAPKHTVLTGRELDWLRPVSR